jgi:heme/copper-type cytochrome/quinol oxidase subunit 4
MAFILAGIFAFATVVMAVLMIMAAGMSDNPSAADDAGRQAIAILTVGLIVAVLIAVSHWLPHIGW